MDALGSGGPAPSLDADTAFACFIQCNLSHGVVPIISYFHFPRTALFGASTLCFHGIDVRPVIFGATCHIASANDTEPCKTLGRVSKHKPGGPATFKPLPNNWRETRCQTTSLEITSNQQLRGKAPNPGPRGVHFTSMDTYLRWPMALL